MTSTSRWLLAGTGGPTSSDKRSQLLRGLGHIALATVYALAVVTSFSVVYEGTRIAIAWPAVGIAVWWAVTCRSWRVFAMACAFIFLVPASYLYFFSGSSLSGVILIGFSHLIAGPAIGPIMAISERVRPTELEATAGKLFAPFAQIRIPRHVYRLLIASLVMVPLAKIFTLLAFANSGADVSLTLYTSLVLRDLTGIITVAAPGIAISSSSIRTIRAGAIRELIVVVVVTAAILGLIFNYQQDLPIVYLAMLPLYWSATRLPVMLAVIHAVFTSTMTVVLSIWVGTEPFALPDDSLAQAAAVQLFAIISILLSLVVSTTVQQHAALQAEFKAVAETIPDALLLSNSHGNVFPVNAAAQKIVEKNQDGLYIPRKLLDLEGEKLTDLNQPSKQALRGETVTGMAVQFAVPTEDELLSERRVFIISATPLYLPGETTPRHALLLFHDSTDEQRTMQQLRRAHDEARHLFEYAPQGVATVDAQGKIIQANSAFGELVGLPAEQLPGRTLDEFSPEADVLKDISPALQTPGALIHADRCFKSLDGRNLRVALSFRTMSGEDTAPEQLLLNAVDVTERQQLHELVSHLADHDALTGLVNRRRFESDFKEILRRSEADSSDGALLMIDLDNFKLVNDILGHQAGDELLTEFAHLLRECARADDIVARLGGDEFVIILPDTDRSAALTLGGKIVETVHNRFKRRPDVVQRVTASIGITMFSEARKQEVDPFLLADQLLYDAKRTGRNRLVAFETGGLVEHTERPAMSREQVRQILESDALFLEFQPILEVSSGEIVAAEGLLRLDPAEALITTYELIQSVERSGFGPKLDKVVLPKGIAMLAELQRIRPGFRVSLNLSAQSLGSEELCQTVIAALQEHQIPPGTLVLEITESAPLVDLEAAREFQRTLQEHGVNFALDDFGAGHDPYRYLKQLDFMVLKIAGEFVEGMVHHSIDRSIVRSLVNIAEEQGMSTVAEFVSDEKVLAAVQHTGITFAQGFHIGRSLPLRDFITTHL